MVAAVELDDKTHARPDRVAADAKKDKALAAAGIALVRWNFGALPDESAIRQAFAGEHPHQAESGVPSPATS